MHLRFLPKYHLVTGGNNVELVFMEFHEGIDTQFWVVWNVVGLSVPKIIIEDEDGAFIRQSPSKLCIEEGIVHPMQSIDMNPVEVSAFVLGSFLEECHQAGKAELLDNPERATSGTSPFIQRGGAPVSLPHERSLLIGRACQHPQDHRLTLRREIRMY